MNKKLLALKREYPFPKKQPDKPFDPSGWLCDRTKEFLLERLPDQGVVLEIGCYLGQTTRLILENSGCDVIAVDIWVNSEWREQFYSNQWDLQERVIPLHMRSTEAMATVFSAGINPNIVFLDGSHMFINVVTDIVLSADLFPHARIIGDDLNLEFKRENGQKRVKEAVEEFCRVNRKRHTHNCWAWEIIL